MITSWQESNDKPRQCVGKQRHYSANKAVLLGCGITNGHLQLWEPHCEEGRPPKNWCLRTVVLENSWKSLKTARISNQSILREINPKYSLEGLMLKVKLQYFGHLMRTIFGKVPDAGKDRGQKEKRVSEPDIAGWHHWCNEHELGRWWGTGRPGVLQFMGLQRVRHDWVTEQQQLVII